MPKTPSSSSSSSSDPPWEALFLIARHLDAKTLAIASCVSKSWFSSMSSDHLWHPICSAHFPAFSHLRDTGAGAAVPYHLLYTLGRAAALRRLRRPPKPRVSLDDLLFTIDIFVEDRLVATVARPGEELGAATNGVFRFEIDVGEKGATVERARLEGVRVTWHVVAKGWTGAVAMVEGGGKGSFGPAATMGWFSEELLTPGCCAAGAGGRSGLVAELKLGFCGGGGGDEVRVEKVCVGVLSIMSWSYLSIECALRHLQHFILP
ncbi:probable F-box protein At5g04010 [Malania oleifera]|uniref:probable F-box protein At5g04010 n=1 Tax=Malania oleifera TaxID=397392 RepID=UPI0025AE0D77|nr:probable F-box protein At5g04010 [Malania oleifera]